MSFKHSDSSGIKTASAQITTMSGALAGIDVVPPAMGSCQIKVYDVAVAADAADSNAIANIHVDAGLNSYTHEYMKPVTVNNGIYAVLTESGGSGTEYIVRYALG